MFNFINRDLAHLNFVVSKKLAYQFQMLCKIAGYSRQVQTKIRLPRLIVGNFASSLKKRSPSHIVLYRSDKNRKNEVYAGFEAKAFNGQTIRSGVRFAGNMIRQTVIIRNRAEKQTRRLEQESKPYIGQRAFFGMTRFN
jgi:hypothetical protein